jgi:anti-sigma B factor antagonist
VLGPEPVAQGDTGSEHDREANHRRSHHLGAGPVGEEGGDEAEGRLNAVTAAALAARVGEAVEEGRSEIVCDLSGVTFLDSSGLAGLVAAVEVTVSAAGSSKLAAASDEVRRMFALTGLDRVFSPHPTIEALVAGDVAVQEIRRAA